MYFEYPKLLWLLAVPALLVLHYLWMELRERRPHLRVSKAAPWLQAGTSPLAILRHLPFLLRLLIINTAPLIGHFLALTRTRFTNIAFFVIVAVTFLLTAYNVVFS